MHLHTLRLVRIIADPSQTAAIVALLAARGARTCLHSSVATSDPERSRATAQPALTLTESLVSALDAEAILRAVHDELQPYHAAVAYAVEAQAYLREQRL
ncbi:MAG TPA: hypothetical protein DGD08_13220 [Gemmatimonas aurantiaca]|nr:hypothetical protein [Gemmatimonas aurantiaca]HCT58159.1 hypothetical protein [Gemmatimonas aurantiaca]